MADLDQCLKEAKFELGNAFDRPEDLAKFVWNYAIDLASWVPAGRQSNLPRGGSDYCMLESVKNDIELLEEC